jgi:hypothetical protein
MTIRQFVCEHGHAYYDGDQGLGDPGEDGYHDAVDNHGHADVTSWEEWERHAYEAGWAGGSP